MYRHSLWPCSRHWDECVNSQDSGIHIIADSDNVGAWGNIHIIDISTELNRWYSDELSVKLEFLWIFGLTMHNLAEKERYQLYDTVRKLIICASSWFHFHRAVHIRNLNQTHSDGPNCNEGLDVSAHWGPNGCIKHLQTITIRGIQDLSVRRPSPKSAMHRSRLSYSCMGNV